MSVSSGCPLGGMADDVFSVLAHLILKPRLPAQTPSEVNFPRDSQMPMPQGKWQGHTLFTQAFHVLKVRAKTTIFRLLSATRKASETRSQELNIPAEPGRVLSHTA